MKNKSLPSNPPALPLPKGGRRARRRGVAMVETAIAFVFLTVLIFSIIQFALIENAIITVQYYAKEGSRYGLVHYADPTFSSTTTVQGYLQTYVAQSSSLVPYSSLTVKVYPPSSPATALDSGLTPPSNTLTVEVSYDLANKVLFSQLVPGSSQFGTYTYYSTSFAEGE